MKERFFLRNYDKIFEYEEVTKEEAMKDYSVLSWECEEVNGENHYFPLYIEDFQI